MNGRLDARRLALWCIYTYGSSGWNKITKWDPEAMEAVDLH